MRLIADQNLPTTLAERLRDGGHDAIHTAEIGLERATDPEVFATCVAQGRTLVTADKKLTKFLASTRATDPSVIIVRGPSRGGDVTAMLLANLAAIEELIAVRGPAVFSLAPGKPVRVELLPLGSAG